jgi:predicted dehydrogenase
MAIDRVKLAIIGVGGMGSAHARDISNLPNTELSAVCDILPDRAKYISGLYGCKWYPDYREMLDAGGIDGVLIATPHYAHTPIAIDCLNRGLNVLTEKPIAAHLADAHKMIAAYQNALIKTPALQFAIMFQQRTYGYWQKVKQMLAEGDLGRLVRATWIITDWFRTQSYYDNGQWRATWGGEGGGVLLNQSPHNLDLYQWFMGMPQQVTGFTSLGKYHHIEVEDEVTAFFEHENGMVGHFITSTAESPGTNRLEIVGEGGKLVVENGGLTFWRNHHSMFEQIRTSPDSYEPVANVIEDVPFLHHGQPGHALVIENFANAILKGEPLIVPAPEGIHQIHLGNAIMLSSFIGKPVELPIDAAAYASELAERARNSPFQKVVHLKDPADITNSFGK